MPTDKSIRSAIEEVLGCPMALWLFGSGAEGRLRDDSDLDLAVLMPAPIEPLRCYDAAQELALRLGRDVDLIDLHAAPPALRAEVVGRGRRLAVADARVADLFACHALADYARLNEERAPVLHALGVGA